MPDVMAWELTDAEILLAIEQTKAALPGCSEKHLCIEVACRQNAKTIRGIVAWLREESEKTSPGSVRSASCNGLASALAQAALAAGLEWPVKEVPDASNP